MITAVIVLTLAVILAYAGRQREVAPQLVVFLAIFFCAGGALALLPEFANRLAMLVGVGRGADLLLYFAVLAGLFLAIHFYFRFRRIEQTITMIVRKMALTNPHADGLEKDLP